MAKFSEKFVNAVLHVWTQIGHDITQSMEADPESMDNESAVESCIDADMLTRYDNGHGQAAEDEFEQRALAVGYGVALKEAAESLPYRLV